jgi:hypothetical protein
VTEIAISDNERTRTDTVTDWLTIIAASPLINVLRITKRRGPNLSAKTPAGKTKNKRQMFGTVMTNPASKIVRLNSIMNTGTNATGIARKISISMWLIQTVPKGFARALTLKRLAIVDNILLSS